MNSLPLLLLPLQPRLPQPVSLLSPPNPLFKPLQDRNLPSLDLLKPNHPSRNSLLTRSLLLNHHHNRIRLLRTWLHQRSLLSMIRRVNPLVRTLQFLHLLLQLIHHYLYRRILIRPEGVRKQRSELGKKRTNQSETRLLFRSR